MKKPLSRAAFLFPERKAPVSRATILSHRNARKLPALTDRPAAAARSRNPRLVSPARPVSTLVSYRSTVCTFDSNRSAVPVVSPGPIHLKPEWLSANHFRFNCLHPPLKSSGPLDSNACGPAALVPRPQKNTPVGAGGSNHEGENRGCAACTPRRRI